jgi:hypothetical protein
MDDDTMHGGWLGPALNRRARERLQEIVEDFDWIACLWTYPENPHTVH